jgi:probable phosphoglycerate mutase
MALFYLIRHGSNDYLGKGLAGRLPDVHLNAQGKAEADHLAAALTEAGITRILSSPLERTRETAEPLSRRLKLPVETCEEVMEVDFGEWNGAELNALQGNAHWARYNVYRSGTRIPNGELVIEIQSRFVRKLELLRKADPAGVIAIFSHGDPIRSALCYYLGIPLDFLHRFEISPASYSVLKLEDWGPEVLNINRLPGTA